jgi:hypothetical protein
MDIYFLVHCLALLTKNFLSQDGIDTAAFQPFTFEKIVKTVIQIGE